MRIIPAAVLALLAAAAITAERPVLLADILERHSTAVGAPIAAIEVDLLIEEPAFTVTGQYRADRSGDMRIDVYAGDQRVFSEALDGDGGWQQHAEGEREPLSDDGRAALRRGIIANLYTLRERRAHGYTLVYRGTATVNGQRLWKISSRAPDGFEELYYLDPGTALIVRKEEYSALHPDIDATEVRQATIFSDYRPVKGRMLAHRMQTVDTQTGEILQNTSVQSAAVTPLERLRNAR